MNKLKKAAVIITAAVTMGFIGNMSISHNPKSDINMTAGSYYSYGDFEYSIYTDGTCIIDKYSGTAETVSIPSVVNGYKVIRIGSKAFSGNTKVKKVILPDTISEMYDSVFKGCSSLETINTPDSLKSIGTSCFENCSKLKSFNFNKVEKIGWYALKNCKSLGEIYVPGTIKEVSVGAFDGCSNLKTLTFAEGVVKIGMHAALNTAALEKITIPKSVTTIDKYAIGYSIINDCLTLTVDNLKEYNYIPDTAAEKYGLDNNIIKRLEGSFSYENFITPVTPPVILHRLGDTDNNGSIDSSDASTVLAEYSSVQTGGKESFTDEQKRVSDVNRDDVVDASDASEILRYYSEASTGKTPVWSFVEDIPAKINRSENS